MILSLVTEIPDAIGMQTQGDFHNGFAMLCHPVWLCFGPGFIITMIYDAHSTPADAFDFDLQVFQERSMVLMSENALPGIDGRWTSSKHAGVKTIQGGRTGSLDAWMDSQLVVAGSGRQLVCVCVFFGVPRIDVAVTV